MTTRIEATRSVLQPSVLLGQAQQLHRRGSLAEAENLYRKALESDRSNPEALSGLGTLMLAQGNGTEGVRLLAASLDATAIRPHFASAYNNRGVALQRLNRPQEALASYCRAIALAPDYAEAYSNRGLLLSELGRLDEALESCERAICLAPHLATAHCNRAVVLLHSCRYGDAVKSAERAIELAPGDADAHRNRGLALQGLARWSEALQSYDRAVDVKPEYADAIFDKAVLNLQLGNFEEGWRSYESRLKRRSRVDDRAFAQPLWLGAQSIAGRTVLLHSEQGYGDTMQFCRYATPVSELGATVIMEVPAPLVDLLRSLDGVSMIVAKGQSLPEFDFHCPLPSLPLAFETVLDTIPARVPYLAGDAGRVTHWKRKLGTHDRLRVGLTWSSGFAERAELVGEQGYRDVALSRLDALNVPNVDFYSLQKGESAERQLKDLAATGWNGPRIIDFTSEIRDFADTAALIENLDLVVTVCTSVAHLAGALGKQTWILLKHRADWRWLVDRSDSPWYPNATLFRQVCPNDWTSVIAGVRERLIELAGRRR